MVDLSRRARLLPLLVPDMVSESARAACAPGSGSPSVLRALFPGGSITGAPKLAAIDHIARLEPVGRGASMGALGVVHPNGDLDLGADDPHRRGRRRAACTCGSAAASSWDSDPAAEVEESLVKARPLARLIGAELPDGRP